MPIATCSIALLATAIAALTDARSARIPNWITYPLLLLGPLLSVCFAQLSPLEGLLSSVFGIVCCGLVPVLLFARSAMGGGDVKLLAALGGLLGPYSGIEVQFFSFCVVTVLLLGRMAWDGKLFATLRNTLRAAGHLFLPERLHAPLEPTMLTNMRMGIPIFVATALSVLLRGPL
jgi:prepilin peptidase CpaA